MNVHNFQLIISIKGSFTFSIPKNREIESEKRSKFEINGTDAILLMRRHPLVLY
jgi:hypothetical protein